MLWVHGMPQLTIQYNCHHTTNSLITSSRASSLAEPRMQLCLQVKQQWAMSICLALRAPQAHQVHAMYVSRCTVSLHPLRSNFQGSSIEQDLHQSLDACRQLRGNMMSLWGSIRHTAVRVLALNNI